MVRFLEDVEWDESWVEELGVVVMFVGVIMLGVVELYFDVLVDLILGLGLGSVFIVVGLGLDFELVLLMFESIFLGSLFKVCW